MRIVICANLQNGMPHLQKRYLCASISLPVVSAIASTIHDSKDITMAAELTPEE